MQIDELRGELTTLANEMEPFEGDVRFLHHHERRRRIVTASVAVALVVAVISTAAFVRHDDTRRIRVTGTGSKEVSPAQLPRIDVIVVPASSGVQHALDALPRVAQYARVPRGYRGPRVSIVNLPSDVRCALETNDGFAVRSSSPGGDFAAMVRQHLGKQATVFDVSEMLGFDVELFLKVGASSTAVTAIESRLAQDASVESFQYVSPSDAYDIFKRDFADQPALVASTKPSDLPASFRIALEPGSSAPGAQQRYEHLGGVDTALTKGSSGPPLLFTPNLYPPGDRASACAKP